MLFFVLLIAYFVFFAYLSWKRLDLGIYLTILALPSYLVRFSVFGIPATVFEGMVLVLFLVWTLKQLQVKSYKLKVGKEIRKFALPIGLFLLTATVGMFVAPDLRVAAGIWKAYFIEPILFLVVFVSTIKTSKQVKRVLWALGLSILVPGVLAIVQKFTGVFIDNPFWYAEETRRVTSVYGFPNAIGLYFAPIVTLLVGVLVSKSISHKVIEKVLLALLIVIGFLSIVFALSKGALLGVFLGLVFYALFYKGKRLFFTGVVLGILVMLIFTPQLRSLSGTSTVEGGGSLEVRLEQWGETWEMLKAKPILGAGLSGYKEAVEPYHEKEYIEVFMYPHNVILNFWSEIGLFGLLVFLWLIVLFYRKGFGLQSPVSSLPIMAAMVTLLGHGLVDVPYFKNDLSVLFWVLIGLMIVLSNIRDKELNNNV